MKLPVVEANFAMSIDGKVTTRDSAPTGFTSARDKRRLLEIRARGDALMVGRRTLETDNMSMGLPSEDLREERLRRGQAPEPLRVIVSGRGLLSPRLKVFRTPGAPIVVFTTPSMPRATRAWLERVADVRVGTRTGGVDLRRALGILADEYGVRTVVCEGGPGLMRTMVLDGFVRRLHVTFAPVVFGGADAPTLLGPAGVGILTKSVPLRLEGFRAVEGEVFAAYEFPAPRKGFPRHGASR